MKSQKEFHSKYNLPFSLIADPSGKLTKAFGVPLKLGKFAARQSFLIKEGIVIWRDLKAKPSSQAQDAIQASLTQPNK